jgi:DNA adenine methylase
MPTYFCEICEKLFKQKVHYDTHKNRKNPCKKPETPILKLSKPLIRPFLKWVGGKTQIIELILSKFPKTIKTYYEPFLGGGSVLLGFLSHTNFKGEVFASDVNPYTIAIYKHIQSNVESFIKEIKQIVEQYNSIKGTIICRKAFTLEDGLTSKESYYYYLRNKFNGLANKESIEASAILLFLNKTCFRGVYREGPHGFNVPFGHYDNPAVYDENDLREISNLIKNVHFKACSFEDALAPVKEGDFVYLDPPYAPETKSSFVSYVEDGFGMDKHVKLFKICKEMKGEFLMSNAEVDLVKNSFPEPYTTVTVSCRRAINAKDPSARTNEVLISNLQNPVI